MNKSLLSINTQYKEMVKMVSKEFIITTATILLLAYTASLSLVSQAFPADQTVTTFSNSGSIQIQTTAQINIYEDYYGQYELTSVSWGTLEPGQTQTVDFYVRNEGNTPTTLSFITDNWNPTSAGQYMTIDWDYTGAPIDSDGVRHIRLSLTVDSDIEGIENFSFDMTIIGTT